jgi:hypothetical protein
MATNEIPSWLMRRRRQAVVAAVLLSAAELAGGAVVLGLTFGLFFLAAKIALLLVFPAALQSTAIALALAFLAVLLLFADGFYSVRDDMSILPLWFLREAFEIAPRMLLAGCRSAGRARRLVRMEVVTVAHLLAHLAWKNQPTTRDELAAACPEVPWAQVVAQLQLLGGVIFFQRDPARVTLTMPLRLELRSLLVRSSARPATPPPEPEPVPVSEPAKLSPCEILGVADSASLAEIKTAYRSRVKECHPDRFASLDEHSRQLAEEWTKSLNAAYETLLSQSRMGIRN